MTRILALLTLASLLTGVSFASGPYVPPKGKAPKKQNQDKKNENQDKKNENKDNKTDEKKKK